MRDGDNMGQGGHVPVMLAEVLGALSPAAGEIMVDGTFGAGGYARGLLDAADCTLFAIDRDAQAVARGEALAERFGGRLKMLEGRFSEMPDLLAGAGIAAVDGIALDLGLSSLQLDSAARGFSFRHDGPLDMRMGGPGPSAAELVNQADEPTLADVIRRFGEERHSRRIAGAIVAARQGAAIQGTAELAEIVVAAIPAGSRRGPRGPRGQPKIHPATRTFQALRIWVNDEIAELRRGLAAAEILLRPRGRLAVVSFHSLEDREVKRFLAQRSGRGAGQHRHAPASETPEPSFELIRRRVGRPGAAELAANPRARSARLRAARRTAAPAWQAPAGQEGP
ncbi:MAG TPA: 16S rRNA (cytosine(1402)-N(4))-methyltransferase RsmH [Alphaproteobacteria bacterium]|jgi:16S rRNA (cytosine1402-N4)-methyltransferase|nr:16S rRNA (cytosine(1402)-N(4))-methyltransferase RsmH [Alphaproteobacteria bacterium]MDP6270555.1 16S rRNA (cytosine(1402)-N(4))-methyltransferase RsmH [Alphaproteobacteria bacterium]MDP7164736.1 16S rRNA (cytosine(1402)-N(4))-methyltransferase RsmH [Alphaproteobacteria bacterium]MDP7428296.1 16S rRNA (cytosine(1402)-N(4))-methyltransferase RsmH [Alphaproteobacteria bacterium]HJM51756.1 16S rRNA (cytosine(1402)-N(4))-methyltransferase RsmH [Alphaproteobacteria bacterium]